MARSASERGCSGAAKRVSLRAEPSARRLRQDAPPPCPASAGTPRPSRSATRHAFSGARATPRTDEYKKIGIFGGSFDPVHKGHTAILRAAQNHYKFDRVYVVPAWRNPLKGAAALPVSRRLAALRRVIRSFSFARLSLVEVRQGKPCFMVNTLRYFRRRHPGAEFFLISGSDILDTFHKWKNPAGILRLATIAVAKRPGFKRPVRRAGFEVFPMKPVRESSTRIRSMRS